MFSRTFVTSLRALILIVACGLSVSVSAAPKTVAMPQGGAFNFSTWTGTGGVAYTLNVNNGSVTSTQAGSNIY